jgi:hypothetical protein
MLPATGLLPATGFQTSLQSLRGDGKNARGNSTGEIEIKRTLGAAEEELQMTEAVVNEGDHVTLAQVRFGCMPRMIFLMQVRFMWFTSLGAVPYHLTLLDLFPLAMANSLAHCK